MTDQENNNSISGNPFAALFGSLADAKHFAAGQQRRRPPAGAGGGGRAAGLPPSPRLSPPPPRALSRPGLAGEEAAAGQDDSDNSVSESLEECDLSAAAVSRAFRCQRELCQQLNTNHMLQRIFLITLDNSECGGAPGRAPPGAARGVRRGVAGGGTGASTAPRRLWDPALGRDRSPAPSPRALTGSRAQGEFPGGVRGSSTLTPLPVALRAFRDSPLPLRVLVELHLTRFQYCCDQMWQKSANPKIQKGRKDAPC